MTNSSPLYCGSCLVPVALSIDESWASTVKCPSCMATAPLERAFEDADAYIAAYIKGELTTPHASGAFRFIPCCLTRTRMRAD